MIGFKFGSFDSYDWSGTNSNTLYTGSVSPDEVIHPNMSSYIHRLRAYRTWSWRIRLFGDEVNSKDSNVILGSGVINDRLDGC